MLDSPGHKAGSGPRYAGGPGVNASSRERNPGGRGRNAAIRGANAAARGSSRGPRYAPDRPDRWWGSRPGRLGVAFTVGGAAAGLVLTVLARSEPGAVLGIFLLAGTAAGVLAVHPRAAYLIIPVPPLAYVAAAILAGLLHDHATDTSHTALALGAAQWIAGGFVAMSAATLLAIVVATARRAADWRRGRAERRPLT
jgi:hypothetical protein